ncbi:MAG TPA: PA2779 family protein [Burkholderiales bacterium]|nr:PA2779 family protein [Burkholderiales bacterium]
MLAKRILCTALVISLSLGPVQSAYADLITTEQASRPVPAQRAALIGLLDRDSVALRLQALGIDKATALQRIRAMTDEEVAAIAPELASLPAGGDYGGGGGGGVGIVLILVLIIALLVWWSSRSASS